MVRASRLVAWGLAWMVCAGPWVLGAVWFWREARRARGGGR